MLKKLKALLGLHYHEWTRWEVRDVLRSRVGGVTKLVQTRKCMTCGYTQVSTELSY